MTQIKPQRIAALVQLLVLLAIAPPAQPVQAHCTISCQPASNNQLIRLARNNARAQNHPGNDQLFRALGSKDRNGSHADENAEERPGPTQHKQHQIDDTEQVALAGDGGRQNTTKNNG